MDINSLRKLVEGQLLRLEGNAFQDCMDRLGMELYPGDYQPVRAAGPKGDTKNDGYCPKARVFLATHATRGERLDRSKAKIRSDLEGCLREHRDVKVWRFLTNDTLAGEVDQFVDNELRPLFPAVAIEVWGLKTLADEVCKLSRQQVNKILDISSDEQATPVRIVPNPQAPPSVTIRHMATGRQLWPVLAECLAWATDEPEDCTEDEEDLIDGIMQTITDWLEISGAVESRAGVRETQRSITGLLDDLGVAGFKLYAGTQQNLITGGNAPPSPFPLAVFCIVRADEASTTADNQ